MSQNYSFKTIYYHIHGLYIHKPQFVALPQLSFQRVRSREGNSLQFNGTPPGTNTLLLIIGMLSALSQITFESLIFDNESL